MGWLWPRIESEAQALRAISVAALIPAFCSVMLALHAIHNGSWILAVIGGVILGCLAIGVHLASRFAALGTLAILGVLVFMQPLLFGPWLCGFLSFAYGVRGSFTYWAFREQRGRTDRGAPFEPFLSSILSWFWPPIRDSRAALRLAQRAGLLVLWLGVELGWIEIRHAHLGMGIAELAVTAILLFTIARGSRLAPLLILAALIVTGRVFLPIFPLRPQHFLAIPLLVAAMRGSFAYHFWLWREREEAISRGGVLEPDFDVKTTDLAG